MGEMGMPGFGVMIHALSGGSPKSPKDYYGRKIESAKLEGDAIFLTFSDGVTIKIWDDGQSCCEIRYTTCDDDINSLAGGELRDISVSDGLVSNSNKENDDNDWDSHEIAFLKIQTDKIAITAATHNNHNGYYGGFALSLDEVSS